MDAEQKYLACGGTTEIGFVPTGYYSQVEWWQGEPFYKWFGLNLLRKKPQQKYRITTLRCTKCGYLMHYASLKKLNLP